jgi:carbonic anhydrase
MELDQPQSVSAHAIATPDDALKELLAGNARFVSGKTTAHEHDIATLRRDLAEQQAPCAAVLTCADSRVPVEIVFDQTVGHLFVARVAGNMVTPEIIASLEFGVALLATKVILVMGHSNCGAVKAAIANTTVPGQISSLYPYLRPAVDQAGPDAKAVTEANAKIQVRLLTEASTVVAAKVKSGEVKVVAGYYDIGSGKVTVLD